MGRPFRLCTLDLDGTLLQGTCFLTLAEALGKGDVVRELDARYESGAMTLRDNFAAEYALFVGMRVREAQAILRRGPWLAGMTEGVRELRALGLRVGLLTDQPRFLAEVAEPSLDPLLCSEGDVRGGVVAPEVEHREDKLASLRGWCSTQRIPLGEVVHCGNGSNDVPVFRAVGLGVAVNPSREEVAEAAEVVVRDARDLRDVARKVRAALPKAGPS